MSKSVRLTLANKCLLLFGGAVVLILASALVVVALRMQTLVQHGPKKRARDFANAYIADEIQLGSALKSARDLHTVLPPDEDLKLVYLPRGEFSYVEDEDEFVESAIEYFQLRAGSTERFTTAVDADNERYYRYIRAIRRSDLATIRGGAAAGFRPMVEVGIANPLDGILLIDLRDPDAPVEQAVNIIYLTAAGIASGLLAIFVFWYITTRLILSPIRLLRDYAGAVSEGNLNIRSDINTGDEYEQLSDMFNHMLDNIRKSDQDLRSINKSLDLKLGELAESNIALYEANKIKGEFLANVSHELRTPLNSINGFAEVLAETFAESISPADEKRKRYINNIMKSSRQLLDLINDLLDLAKIEAGRLELHLSSVSVSDMTEGLINLMRPQAEKAQIGLELDVPMNLPTVHTDAGKLQQILFNFLSNAIKFSPAGGKVTLSAGLDEEDGSGRKQMMRFAVRDDGPGIATEDQLRIFEKFTQLDTSTTREYGGTGLGLTISKELADMLQGEITLDSDTGRGAEFAIIVPMNLERKVVPLMPDLRVDKPVGEG
ncbi:Non-motile and phage-resistance protein [Poriferisphaera corsica]|uniref:histidine kinase n=1 Tax=Poriferisphaera corsica TaxID=2528020 RepID=A0A517YVZ7_9BACT|nr:HAMP domain-containing sensor histidine kinase [Poriferisphaera corsica]QDU34388.1 Non-motile and phage-resistance protein [Poriferisphaera corsica]